MEIFENLNAEQKKAVEKIFGPILVLAGPGTGKTQMLAARIGRILQRTDAHAENILCLTFTENAAAEMKSRLARFIGPAAYRVQIFTFHGFCENTKNKFPDFFAARENFSLATDLEKIEIFREIIDQKNWKFLRPFGENYFYEKIFLQKISDLKRENFSPENFEKLILPEKKRLENLPENFYKKNSQFGKKGEMKKSAAELIEKKIGKMREFCEIWKILSSKKWRKNFTISTIKLRIFCPQCEKIIF